MAEAANNFPERVYLTFDEDPDDEEFGGYLVTNRSAEEAVELGETRLVAEYHLHVVYSASKTARVQIETVA